MQAVLLGSIQVIGKTEPELLFSVLFYLLNRQTDDSALLANQCS